MISPEILEEYVRVGEDLPRRFRDVDLKASLELVAVNARIVEPPPLPEPVCSDPDDDKFLACALASGTQVIATGDKALLKASGYGGIEVLRPRQFVEKYRK